MNWRDLLHKDIRMLPMRERDPRNRTAGAWAPHYFRKGKYWSDLLTVTRILEGFIHANAPLVGGLRAAAQDAPRYPLWRVLTGHEKDLAGGTSLSESVRQNADFFPGFYADIVKAGEESGTLPKSFATLREIIQHIVEQRTRVWQYKIYIGAVWSFLAAVFLFMAVKVTPVFVDVLKDVAAGPPRATRIVEAVAQYSIETIMFCFSHTAVFVVACAVVIAAGVYWKRRRRQRIAANTLNILVDGILLRTPVLGHMLQKRSLAHIAEVLEKLLGAGMPVDDALDAAAALDVHPLYGDALRRVRGRVSGGSSLKAAFEVEPCFPESFRGFVSLGESSGLLPEALSRVAGLYRRQIVKLERILLDLVSPIGIAAAGVGVLVLFESQMQSIASLCAGLVGAP